MGKIIVVGCVDERLPEDVRQFLNPQGLKGKYLLANVPAPSLNYKDQDRTLTKVAKKKGVTEAWLIDHLDCGGYALANEPDNPQSHREHLAKAKSDLVENYGFETVRTFIASPNGGKNWKIKEVHV